MREGWKYKRLGDICESDLGKTLNQSKDDGEMCPYLCAINVQWDKIDLSTLKTARFTDIEQEKYSVRKGDLLICEGGDIGRAAIWDRNTPFQYQNALHRVRFNGPEYYSRFYLLYLLFLKNKGILDTRYGKGVTIQHLVKSSLLSIYVPVPPLPQQERIVAELDLLTGIIDKQKAQLKELDNLAQSIFYDMFGDPVENEKGWQTVRVGSICKDVSYGTSSPASESGKFIYLRMNNITYQGELDLGNVKYIDLSDEDFEKYSVREGDVLFNRTNSADLVGKTTWFHGLPPMVIAGYIIRIRLDSAVFPVYFSSFMNTKGMKILLKAMGKGAVNQSNINAKELRSIILPLPPLALQESFAQKIESIESQKAAINRSIAETQKLFDYTMDKYFG